MLLDNQGLFSDRQAVTVSAASTNYINLGEPDTVSGAPAALVRRVGGTHDIPLLIQVVTTFAGVATMRVDVQVDDNSGFTSARTVASSGTIDGAALSAGYQFAPPNVPAGIDERYVRLYYTLTFPGTATAGTAGAITAGTAAALQSNV